MASPEPPRPAVLRRSRAVAVPGAALLAAALMMPPAPGAGASTAYTGRHTGSHAGPSSAGTTAIVRQDPPRRQVITPAPAPARTTPARAVPAIEPVAASRPVRFRFSGPGFSVTSRVCAMPNAMVLDPPGNPRKQVCWVEAPMGQAPGSRTDTTYILGHSYASDPHTVLARMSRLASAQIAHGRTVLRSGVPTRTITALAGSTLTLWTARGELTYRVGTTFAVPKPQFGLVRRIEDDTLPRRVVLVTCAVHGGRDLDYNIIVEARLVAARPGP